MDIILLSLTMLLSPLIFCPLLTFDGYILPQITIVATGIIMTLLFVLSNGQLNYNLTVLLVLIYFVYLMTTNIWSTCLHNSHKDIPLVFSYLIGFVLLFTILQTKNAMMYIFIAASTATVLTSCYALLQKRGIDWFFPERVSSRKSEFDNTPINKIAEFYRNNNFIDMRAISTLGNTNFAAGFFVCGLPFVFGLSILIHWSFIVLVIPVILAIFATNSRAGLLSILGGSYFFLLIEVRHNWIMNFILSRSEIELFFIQLMVSCLVCYLLHKYFVKLIKVWDKLKVNNKLNTMLDIEDTHKDMNSDKAKDHPVAHLRYRLRYWRAAWWLIKKRFLFGYGLRTYRKEVYTAQAELNKKDDGVFLGPNYQTPQPRECHNDIIENFVEGGFIGGTLFIVIVGIIFSHGLFYFENVFNSNNALLMGILLSGIVAILINSFFFFPLRLGPSSLYFWSILSIIEYMYISTFGISSVFAFNIHFILLLLLGVILFYLLYICIVKQNIANFYFNKYTFSTIPEKKEIYLNKSVNWSPKDNIFRTHMLISYMAGFPHIADREAQVITSHYDGMTPAWNMAFNCGMAAIANNNYLKAVQCFELSLYYYPSFEPSLQQLKRVWPLAPLPNRGVKVKVIDKNAMSFIQQCQNSINLNTSDEHKKIIELSVIASILDEKVRLNIPQNWPFLIDQGIFLAPTEITGDYIIKEVGHTKLLIARKGN